MKHITVTKTDTGYDLMIILAAAMTITGCDNLDASGIVNALHDHIDGDDVDMDLPPEIEAAFIASLGQLQTMKEYLGIE